MRKSFTYEGRRYFIRGKDELDVAVKIAEKLKKLESGSEVVSSSVTVSDWMAKWLDVYKRPNVSQAWYADMQAIIRNRIEPRLGKLQLKKVHQINVQLTLTDCSGLSRSYVKKVYDILHAAFEKAVENRLIETNPVKGATLPRVAEKEPRRALTDYERHHIIELSKTHRAGSYLMLMLYCGLRPQEVIMLDWRHVDLVHRMIHVEAALKRDGSVGAPKSAAGTRSVPIPEALLPWFADKGGPFAPVCTQASGKRHTRTSLRQVWDSFVYRLNIQMGCETLGGKLLPPIRVAEDLVPYCFRHTYCTDLEASGVPLNVARQLMGHADVTTTARIYTHKSDEPITKALENIDELNRRRAIYRARIAANVEK